MSLTEDEKRIFNLIKIPSRNNPQAPEFPPEKPKFPATPTYRIEVPGFSNVWLKDESANPTGTHKDRMAWEMAVTYKNFLLAKKEGRIKKLPALSILSSGNAAFAIQYRLRKYHLPSLRVLMSDQTDEKIIAGLKKLGCKLYVSDLSKEKYDWQEILKKTDNQNGFDVTSNDAFDPSLRFYDWLSYEIINSNTDFVFIPFGTGQLYENVLNVVKQEITYRANDPRFTGSKSKLKQCSFLGATSKDPRTIADKLYAPFLPFTNYSRQWINYFKQSGMAGPMSDVYDISEKYLKTALAVAKENKIACEPSGMAGLALLLQLGRKIPHNKKILIVNTGKAKWELANE